MRHFGGLTGILCGAFVAAAVAFTFAPVRARESGQVSAPTTDRTLDDTGVTGREAWPADQYQEPVGYPSGNPVIKVFWPTATAEGWVEDEIWSEIPLYVQESIAVFEPIFGTGPTPARPLWLGLVKEVYVEGPRISPDSPERVRTAADGFFDPSVPMIYIPDSIGSSANCLRVVVAHEVAHAFMFMYNNDQESPQAPEWLDEGGAEFLASLVYPEEQWFGCYEHDYKEFANNPSIELWTKRDYDAYPFLRWLDTETGADPREMIKQFIRGAAPDSLISGYELDKNWFEYSRELWGDPRYTLEDPDYACDKSNLPRHAHIGYPENPDQLTDEAPTFDAIFPDLPPYATFYAHFRSEDSELYRIAINRLQESQQEENVKVGAMYSTGTDFGIKNIDLDDEGFAQFAPGSGDDTATIIHHTGNDFAIAVTCVEGADSPCEFASDDDAKWGASIGLADEWELGQLRVNEGKEGTEQRFNVFGELKMRVYTLDDGRVRIVHKTTHFWPNFEDSYYQAALEYEQAAPSVFNSGKTMETFVEESCWFLGKQFIEIKDIDGEQWLEDLEKWEQRLTYSFEKTDSTITIDTAHRFRCVPNVASNRNLALMLFGGGGGTAAQMATLATWVRRATGTGLGEDSWAGQLEDIFIGTLTFGMEEEDETEREIEMAFVQEEINDYLVVNVSDSLSLIYRKVKR